MMPRASRLYEIPDITCTKVRHYPITRFGKMGFDGKENKQQRLAGFKLATRLREHKALGTESPRPVGNVLQGEKILRPLAANLYLTFAFLVSGEPKMTTVPNMICQRSVTYFLALFRNNKDPSIQSKRQPTTRTTHPYGS